jgi:hypothetical protein
MEIKVSWTTGVRFPAEEGITSLRHRVQTGSGVHPASYPMDPGCSAEIKMRLHGVKLCNAWRGT